MEKCRKCGEKCSGLVFHAFACDNCGDEYKVCVGENPGQLEIELAEARAEIERLNDCAGNHRQRRPPTTTKLAAAEKRLVDLRNGFKLCIGLKNGVPWPEVKDSEVDAYVQRVLDFGKAGKEVVDVGR